MIVTALVAVAAFGACAMGPANANNTTAVEDDSSQAESHALVSSSIPSSTEVQVTDDAESGEGSETGQTLPPTYFGAPPSFNQGTVVELLGGELEEGVVPRYPEAYVDMCWDVHLGRGYVYLRDSNALDLSTLRALVGSADIEIVESPLGRDDILRWEDVVVTRLHDSNGYGYVDLGFVRSSPASGDTLCSDTGPVLRISLYPGSHDVDVESLLTGLPPEVAVQVTHSTTVPTDY